MSVYAIVIRMTRSTTVQSCVLSVRVSAAERSLLEAAAEEARTSLSDFIRRKALEAAETDLLQRSIVTIPAEQWDRFEAWVGARARSVPKLEELARTRPAWRP